MKTTEENRITNFIQIMNKNLRLQSDILEKDSSIAIIVGEYLWRFVYYFDLNELDLIIKKPGLTQMFSEHDTDGDLHHPIMTIKDVLIVHLAAKSITLDHLEKLLFMTL